MFSPSELGQGFDQSIVEDCTVNSYSIPPISEDQLRLWLQNAPQFSTISMEGDHLPNSQSENGNPNLEDIHLHGYDNPINTQSCNSMQITIKSHGAEGKEGFEERKRHKRARSTETHNLNERLRRKKLTQKMAALQQMIPNSVKKDQVSTIDDAIKYIKTLQYLIQVMSTGASHAMFRWPLVMMLPHGQQGVEMPSLTPYLQTRWGGNYPMGLHNPWLFQSSAVENSTEQFLGSMHASGISWFGSPPSTS